MKSRINPIFVLFGVLFSFTSFFGFTQALDQDPCAFESYHSYMLESSAEYRESMKTIESQYQKALAKGDLSTKSEEVLTIPTVFHVIHTGESSESNISEEQILSSIEGMNIQWRNMYPDGSPYDPDGTDLKIEFCMAQRDPNGNATNGIVRVDGRSVPDYEANGISSGAGGNDPQVKALSRWPNTEYYNVWVVSKINGQNPWGGGTKGYAQLGPNPAASDGTVVLFSSCGYDLDQNGNDLNRFPLFGYPDNGTMVHEIGHALSLYHTFAGQPNSPTGGACAPEGDCATNGDFVCDTKQHEGDLGTCRNIGDPTCAGDVYDVNIQKNFMNYCSCPSIYTPGQRDRARNMLINSRSSLNTSDACNPVSANDVGIKEVLKPNGMYCDTEVNPEVKVKNLGAVLADSITFSYGLDGNYTDTYTWIGSLVNNTEEVIVFPTISGISVGNHTFNVRVDLVNDQPDENASNNEGSIAFEVIEGEIVTIIVNGNYPSGQFWNLKDKAGNVLHSGNSDNVNLAVCLEKKCYDFEVIDNFNWAGHGLNYEVKNAIGAPMVSGWNTPREWGSCCINQNVTKETDEFCLPFDPGYLTAEFEADKTVIRTGTSVNFTDLSFGGDPAIEWEWNFGDGGTSNQQNPSHVYNAEGVYTVWMAADNIHNFADTATKVHYIRVVDGFNNCSTYNNIIDGETPGTTTMGTYVYPGQSASVLGHAERFWINEQTTLSAVTLTPQVVVQTDPLSVIKVRVFADGGGKPGAEIAREEIPLQDFAVGVAKKIEFSDLPNVNSFYYIGYEYNILPTEDFAVGVAPSRGGADFSNTSFILTNSGWVSTPVEKGSEHVTSLDMTSELSVLPNASLYQTIFEACVDEDVPFDGSLSTNATSISWEFEDGNPATATGPNVTTKFTTDGEKTITLTVVGGCNVVKTQTATINITPKLTASVDVVNEVCDGANGILTALGEGGSGAFSVTWKNGATVVGNSDVLENVSAGTYSAEIVDGRPTCGSITIGGIGVQNLSELQDFDFDISHTTCGDENGFARALPVGGTGNYSYTWDTEPEAYTQAISNLAPGIYSVTVDDGQCAPKTMSISIESSISIVSSITPEADTVCFGTEVIIRAESNDNTAELSWYRNNNLYAMDVDSLIVYADDTEVYEARFTTPDGCTSVQRSYITVPPAPIVNANSFQDTAIMIIDSVKVNFTSAGSAANEYFWEFGDGGTSKIKNPFHYYTAPGDYWVFMTGSNGGCALTDSTFVVVIDDRMNQGNGGTPDAIGEYSKLGVEVFPNPTSDNVYLRIPKGKGAIQVTGISGKTFIQTDFDASQNQTLELNLESFNAGVYFLNIQMDGVSEIHKILKLN